jgi:hypothetical protein
MLVRNEQDQVLLFALWDDFRGSFLDSANGRNRRTAVSASPDRELPLTTQTEPSAAGFWRGVPWRCWAPGACAPPRPIPSGPPPPPADGRE